jgi:hypothetical protein
MRQEQACWPASVGVATCLRELGSLRRQDGPPATTPALAQTMSMLPKAESADAAAASIASWSRTSASIGIASPPLSPTSSTVRIRSSAVAQQ